MRAWAHHMQWKGTGFLGGLAKIEKGSRLLYTKLQCVIFLSEGQKKVFQNENHIKEITIK